MLPDPKIWGKQVLAVRTEQAYQKWLNYYSRASETTYPSGPSECHFCYSAFSRRAGTSYRHACLSRCNEKWHSDGPEGRSFACITVPDFFSRNMSPLGKFRISYQTKWVAFFSYLLAPLGDFPQCTLDIPKSIIRSRSRQTKGSLKPCRHFKFLTPWTKPIQIMTLTKRTLHWRIFTLTIRQLFGKFIFDQNYYT